MTLRILKGLYMGLMFMVFGLVILWGVFFLVPAFMLVAVFKGHNPDRMQAVNRKWMGWWLKGLEAGGLLKVDGVEGKPVAPPSVIVANHPGLFDVIVLITRVPKMSVMVKRSLVRKLPLGPILWSAGYVYAPVGGNLWEIKHFFDRARTVLSAGYHFMMFPEGTRSPKGGLHPFQVGAFKLASRAKVPIQPVLIDNRPPFLPHEDRWYLPLAVRSPLRIRFLEPLPPPKAGTEREVAARVEAMFRQELDIDAAGPARDLSMVDDLTKR